MRQVKEGIIQLVVENVGGIDHAGVSFSSNIMILVGPNATNRTSLLRALMTAFGSEHISLKDGADEGCAELDISDSTYLRTLSRTGDAAGPAPISIGGEPYAEDIELADLFAFLVETNEARQAVARGDDLREPITHPIDADALQAEIDQPDQPKDRCPTSKTPFATLRDRTRNDVSSGAPR